METEEKKNVESGGQEGSRMDMQTLKSLLYELFSLAGPNLASFIADLAFPIASTFFLGQIGSEYQGAAVLGNLWCNAFGHAILMGLSIGLDSLAPQAFGSKDYALVGLYCQRALVITTVACIPVVGIWLLCEPALVFLLGVPRDVARLAGLWVRCRLPGLWPFAAFECFRRYFQAQRLAWPTSISCTIVGVYHLLSTWLFVTYLHFEGAAYAICFSQWLLLLLLIGLVLAREYVLSFTSSTLRYPSVIDTWPPLVAADIFSGWGHYLVFAVPSAISLVVEWGGYEVYSGISATLGSTALATQSIMNTTTELWYAVPLSISTACSTLIGNALGAGDVPSAKRIAIVGFLFVMAWGFGNGAAGLLYARQWGRIFSNDDSVTSLTEAMFPMLFVYEVFDCLKCYGMTVLRGSGRATKAALGNFLSQLLIGYPASFLCTRVMGWGFPGLWLALSISWFLCGAYYCVVLLRTDWESEVRKAAHVTATAKSSSTSLLNEDEYAVS